MDLKKKKRQKSISVEQLALSPKSSNCAVLLHLLPQGVHGAITELLAIFQMNNYVFTHPNSPLTHVFFSYFIEHPLYLMRSSFFCAKREPKRSSCPRGKVEQ
jgi:hypothetical protein